MSAFLWLTTCFPPGPWQASQPMFISLYSHFCAAGFFGSYESSLKPVVWQVAQLVSQSFFCP